MFYYLAGDIHCNIGNIATFEKDGKDPLVTKDENDSENEDDGIKSDDNLVLIGHVEGDASTLEIFGLCINYNFFIEEILSLKVFFIFRNFNVCKIHF